MAFSGDLENRMRELNEHFEKSERHIAIYKDASERCAFVRPLEQSGRHIADGLSGNNVQ